MSSFLSWIVGGDTKEKEWHGKKTFSGVDSDNNHTGSTYEGNWLGEKKHGYGVWRRDDNLAWYKGNWHENKRHGEGEYHWANATSYSGKWTYGQS